MFNIFSQLQSRIVSVFSFQETIRIGLNRPENRLNQPCFGHLNIKKFEFVSDFDIRISNLSTFGTPKVELLYLLEFYFFFSTTNFFQFTFTTLFKGF
jgi:hypothetical protein